MIIHFLINGVFEVYKAFDQDSSTCYQSDTNLLPRWCEIDLPEGVFINPSIFSITYNYITSTGVLQGYNEQSSSWIEIYSFSETSSQITSSITCTKNIFFNKFRIYETQKYGSR